MASMNDDDIQGDLALAVFVPLYQAHPEEVAKVFATIASHGDAVDAQGLYEEIEVAFGDDCISALVESIHGAPGGDNPDDPWCALAASRLDHLLIHAAMLGLVEDEMQDDGDGEGPPSTFWHEYRMSSKDRAEMTLLGARRWIEKHLPNGSAPVPSPIAPTEIDKLLAGYTLTHVRTAGHVLALLEPLVGTGETPRPIDPIAAMEAALRRMGDECLDADRRATRAELTIDSINAVVADYQTERTR